jgi:hypothetical protein
MLDGITFAINNLVSDEEESLSKSVRESNAAWLRNKAAALAVNCQTALKAKDKFCSSFTKLQSKMIEMVEERRIWTAATQERMKSSVARSQSEYAACTRWKRPSSETKECSNLITGYLNHDAKTFLCHSRSADFRSADRDTSISSFDSNSRCKAAERVDAPDAVPGSGADSHFDTCRHPPPARLRLHVRPVSDQPPTVENDQSSDILVLGPLSAVVRAQLGIRFPMRQRRPKHLETSRFGAYKTLRPIPPLRQMMMMD